MRGFTEPRNLALAITRRAGGPSYSRNFSAGIGRGRGGESGKYDDAEEPLFSASYGHGAPKGGPLNAGVLGRGGSHNSSPGAPFSGSSAGRGFNNLNQTETHSVNNGPLFSNVSFGRGSVSRNQGGDPKPQQRPALNLGSGGFGRGRSVENNDALPEDIFSPEERGTLSSWSKWDQKLGKVDAKNDPSPAEMRLVLDERSSSVLPFPAIPQQQRGQRGHERQTKALQSPGIAPSFQAAPPYQQPPSPPAFQSSGNASPFQAVPPKHQPPSPLALQSQGIAPSFQAAPPYQEPPSSPAFQSSGNASPFQAVPPQHQPPSPLGWQQPAQQPYHDTKFQPWPSMQNAPSPTGWPQPVQRPVYDARVQLQPRMQSTQPPTGWQQPVQQPNYDARVQPQPSIQYTPPPTDLNSGWQQPVQQPYYDVNVQPQPSIHYTPPPSGWQQQTVQQPYMQYTPPPTAWQPPASPLPPQAYFMQQQPPPGSPGRQPIHDLPGKSGQPHGAFATDDWRPPSSGGAMQWRQQPFDPVQPSSESHQGHPYGGEFVEPLVAPPSSVNVSGSNYNWGPASPESICVSEQQQTVSVPTHGHRGLDYEGKVDDLYKQNKLMEIDDIYREMKAAQIRASAKTYGTILQSYLQLGKMDKVSMIYQEMSGVLFAGEKYKDEVVKETTTARRVEAPTPHRSEGAASSTKTPRGAQAEAEYEEDREVTFSRTMETPSSGTGVKSFTSSGQPEPSVGRGMGRGIKVERHGSEQSVGTGRGGATFGQPEPIVGRGMGRGMKVERHGSEPRVGTGRGGAASPGSGQGAQFETKHEEDGDFTFSRNIGTPSTSSDTEAQSFTSFGAERSVGRGVGRGMKVETYGSEPSVGTGRGRGKVGSFFNFDLSAGVGSADQGAAFGKKSLQFDQESKTEVQDEYSQTFTPVIQHEWYAFAPEGLSVGPGAGRGRPQSPQARGLGLQQAPPLYSLDSRSLPDEPQFSDPEEEPLESSLSAEEAEAAAERAMRILTEKRVNRYKNMFEFDDQVVKRSPLGLARSLRERKQPKMPEKVEKAVRLTGEDELKEAETLKAMEENETLKELQHSFDQFMKTYGEMGVEPEHELGDFTNPDIEEKPFMPFEEYLEKAKPNIMKTGLIRSEKEWQDMVQETIRHLPYYEAFVERHGGPGRYTAKQENEDLEEIAGTLPSDVGRAAKSFVQRSLTTMKSNPGLNLQQKQWMLASMVMDQRVAGHISFLE
ncbi:hypothetical protein GOP47_0019108 [Adiantum capillus-veneris]|uniref:Uncharacterized protein n=1 Tax=Adiantum capillus-veneris TaxID=13818 RepID=A0A9D4UEH2_ADICA|nr:hypothetical protein GOP47_0019108 [Adiantum capillus-veneris]